MLGEDRPDLPGEGNRGLLRWSVRLDHSLQEQNRGNQDAMQRCDDDASRQSDSFLSIIRRFDCFSNHYFEHLAQISPLARASTQHG
jgi:hypothetical protein